MNRNCFVLLVVATTAAATVLCAAEPVDFNRDVRPILFAKCVRCHGPDAEQSGTELRLDLEHSAKAMLNGARPIVPGKSAESGLILRITSPDPAERMPPADSGVELSGREIDLLRDWIEQGAPWSRHWSFVLPRRHPLPDVGHRDWPLNWIDRFVLARLEREQLRPLPDADRVTLVRRLHFDLSGLPPSPQAVAQFVESDDPEVYERLVDRLLASQRFGERLAMYWLDLVRYANTVGYHGDQEHHISPYRDYVIDAFNSNLRFDDFTREQLAGDLIPGSTVDQQIASGYNRLLQTSHEGGVQPKEYLAIYAADRIRNLSAVWLGLTLGCCQCHDHKYDPLTMRDFYSLQAFFADIDEARHLGRGADRTPTVRAPEMKVLSKGQREQIAQLERQIQELAAPRKQQKDAADAANPAGIADVQARIARLERQREAIQEQARLTMITVAIEPRPIRILGRGNWLDDSGPLVMPAVPQHLGQLDLGSRRPTRLDLANWLTEEQGIGGLTARVMANRFWYLLFGSGISKVLDDFGSQGEAPAQPELLDNLAIEFLESDWNVKRLIKLLVMSRTYRQSSLESKQSHRLDAAGLRSARQMRFRLPAEMVRDNGLAISGLLVLDEEGTTARPYQPPGYYRHLNFPKRTYQADADQRQWRRGVYVHWQRQFLHPMLKAFDAPSREECTAERARSNTPLAAMTLLNDPTFVEAARVFAEMILREAGSAFTDRLDFAYLRAVSRRPTAAERELLAQLLQANQDYYRQHPSAAGALVRVGQAPAAQQLELSEHAAWTAVARALLCLNETMTRN